MKKRYFLIGGVLLLLFVGGYYITSQKQQQNNNVDDFGNENVMTIDTTEDSTSKKVNETNTQDNTHSQNQLINYIKNDKGEITDINFYNTQGVLISTFNLKENNPFLSTYTKIITEKDFYDFYKLEKDKNYSEIYDVEREKIDYISYDIKLPPYFNLNSKIVPIFYNSHAINRIDGNIDATSILFVIQEGEVITRKIFKGYNNELYFSENSSILAFTNLGVVNSSEEEIITGKGLIIWDLIKNENVTLDYLSKEIQSGFLGLGGFAGNKLVFSGEIGGQDFYMCIDFETNKQYFKKYSKGQYNIDSVDNEIYLFDSNKNKILFTQEKYRL